MTALRGKRILVTGATGFIGNRLVERLILQENAEVVALVHQFRNASRLARFPLRMIGGDVRDAGLVRNAAEGCHAIVHCAVSFTGKPMDNRAVTVEGAGNVCEAAKTLGLARLVHFSTFSVYGVTAPGPLTEDSPKEPGNDAYGASKLEAEQLVQGYQTRGLPVTILQPTVVYGPWSFWSTYAARQLVEGNPALPEDGAGLCNAVYVDDVVDAVLLSLQRDTAVRGPFLISAAAPIAWRDYYAAHGAAIPGSAILGLTNEELAALTRPAPRPTAAKRISAGKVISRIREVVAEVPGARRVYRFFKGKKVVPRRLPLAEHLSLLASRSVVQIDRARKELGYEPQFDLSQGGKITADWLRWAAYRRPDPSK